MSETDDDRSMRVIPYVVMSAGIFFALIGAVAWFFILVPVVSWWVTAP